MVGRQQRLEGSSRAQHRPWWPIALLLALVLAACTPEAVEAPDEPVDEAAEDAGGEAVDDTATDDVEGNDEPEETTDESPPPEEEEAEQPTASSDGTATAMVAGEEYEFRIINCLEDVVSPMTGGSLPLLLEAVPPDAPDDLVEPLRGTVTAEEIEELGVEGMQELSAPVMAYGPLLNVTRIDDDGESDMMSLQFEDGTIYQSEFGGFIEVSGSGANLDVTATATVTASNIEDPGAGGSEVGELSVQASC